MDITDREYAADCLKNIGYYRLSGYWYPLRESSLVKQENGAIERIVGDNFRPGSTFDQVINIYTYDKHLRLLMLDILERIEIAIRTDITLQLGQYGPWSYRQGDVLDQRFVNEINPGFTESQFTKFISRFDEMVSRSKSDFVDHFRKKYSDPLPIWAAVELWDFGMLSVFVSGMKYRDKRAVASRYNVPPEIFPSWIRALADVRNICAHHGRLWNRTLVSQPKTANIGIDDLLHLQDGIAREKIYSVIAIARYIQNVLNPTSTWADSIVSLNESFPEAPGIIFKQMGYPDDWRTLSLWK
jgi:abortive infection bacteriophage resistance protein